jgi:hypothetical protein
MTAAREKINRKIRKIRRLRRACVGLLNARHKRPMHLDERTPPGGIPKYFLIFLILLFHPLHLPKRY